MTLEEKLTQVLEQLYERTYDSAERMGRLVGKDLVRQGLLSADEGEGLTFDLGETYQRGLATGLKGGMFGETNPFKDEENVIEKPEPRYARMEQNAMSTIPSAASRPLDIPKKIGRKEGTRWMVNKNHRRKLIQQQDFEKYLKLGWYFKKPRRNPEPIQPLLEKYPVPDWFKKYLSENDNVFDKEGREDGEDELDDFVEALDEGEEPKDPDATPKDLDQQDGD